MKRFRDLICYPFVVGTIEPHQTREINLIPQQVFKICELWLDTAALVVITRWVVGNRMQVTEPGGTLPASAFFADLGRVPDEIFRMPWVDAAGLWQYTDGGSLPIALDIDVASPGMNINLTLANPGPELLGARGFFVGRRVDDVGIDLPRLPRPFGGLRSIRFGRVVGVVLEGDDDE